MLDDGGTDGIEAARELGDGNCLALFDALEEREIGGE